MKILFLLLIIMSQMEWNGSSLLVYKSGWMSWNKCWHNRTERFQEEKNNLVLPMIDYRKVYYIVPHYWLMVCMNLFGTYEPICWTNIWKVVTKWMTEPTAFQESFRIIEIMKCIFPGECLSSLYTLVHIILLTLSMRKADAVYVFQNRQIVCQSHFSWINTNITSKVARL